MIWRKEQDENVTKKYKLTIYSFEVKLDIKSIKEEMNKLIELDHERRKKSLNLVIFCLKGGKEKETLALVKEKLQEKL